MALSPQEKGRIFRYLAPEYQKAYAEGDLNDDDLREWAEAAGVLGAPADFSEVEGRVDTTAVVPPPPEPEPGLIEEGIDRVRNVGGIALDSLVGGGKRSVGAALFTEAELGTEDDSVAGRTIDSLLTPFTGLTSAATDAILSLYDPDGSKQKLLGTAMYREGSAETQDAAARAVGGGGFGDTLTQGIADVSASPSSALSVLGGPAAAIVAGDVFSQEYTEARLAGLDKDDAGVRAGSMAAIEGGLSTIPAGRFLNKIPGLDSVLGREAMERLAGDVSKTVARVTKTTAGEAAEEGLTTLAQLGMDKALSEVAPSEDLRDYARSNLPKDITGVWEETWRSIVAGGVGGTALGGPVEVMRTVAERGRMVTDLTREVDRQIEDRKRPKEVEPTPPETVEWMREGRTREQDIDAAWEQRNTEATPDPEVQRANLMGGVDAARERAEMLQEAVEGGDTSQGTLSSLAAATRDVRRAEQLLTRYEQSIAPKPAPEPAPVAVEAPPVQGPVALSPERAAAREKARESVTALVEGDTKKARERGLSRRATARRNFLRTRTQELSDLAPADRIERLTDEALTWEEQNPLENFITPVTVATPKKPARTKKAETAKPVENPEEVRAIYRELYPEDTPEQIEEKVATHNDTGELDVTQLRKTVGLPSVGAKQTDTKTTDVVRSLVKTMGKGSSKKLSKLIIDGNMQIVDSAEQIPEGAAPLNAAGFYDGERTYIVANRLNPENVVGDMLEIAAHEVKHAADLSGNKTLRTTLGSFVGDKANTQLRKKIEALAGRDNVVAQSAVARATAAEAANPGSYDLELAAYFINEARNQRAKGGLVGTVLGDAVSAVRTAAKKIMPGDYEVNLNDVAYLSDKLLAEAAVSGERLTTPERQPAAVPMIMGPSATIADKFKDRTYTSKDGKQKFVVTDIESFIDVGPEVTNRFDNGERVPLSLVLPHPVLYEAYPQLRELEVEQNPDLDTYTAAYNSPDDGGPGYISIHPVFLKDALLGEHNGPAEDNMRGMLLHEVQHAIQEIEGSAKGGNPAIFRTIEDRKNLRQHNMIVKDYDDAFNAIITNGALGNLGLDDFGNDVISNIILQSESRAISKREASDRFVEVLEGSTISPRGRKLLRDMKKAKADYDKSLPIIQEIFTRTNQQYYDLLGEQEAYNTQKNLNLMQDELPINPEPTTARGGFTDTAPPRSAGYSGRSLIRLDNEPNARNIRQAGIGLPYTPQAAVIAKERLLNPRNTAYIRLQQALATYGALGSEIGQSKELADGMAAVYSHKAMKYFGRLKQGIGLVAKRTKTSPEQVEELIRRRMELIAELPNTQRRMSALSSFIRENPELAPLGQAMQEVAALSRTLLRQMLQDNPNPTPEEVKLMNTINSQYFRYMTQMYAAFQGPEGRKRNELLQKQYRAGRDALRRGATQVPAKYRESFQTWTTAQKYLIDNELTIPTEEGLAEVSQSRLDNLYSTWVGDASRVKKTTFARARADGMTIREAKEYVNETMRQALLERAGDVNDAQLQGKADTLIQAMLDLGDAGTPFAAYYRGFKQDRSILENRVGLPQEIKTLFGEITDPAVRLAVTIAKQGELAGRTRLLMDMKSKGEGKYVIPPHMAGLEGMEKFSATLEGESYGPVAGWKTTPEIAAAISDTLEMFSTGTDALAQAYSNTDQLVAVAGRKLVGGISNIASLQKLLTIVFDVYNLSLNAAGSPLMLMANGVTDVKAIGNALGVGIESIVDTATDGKTKLSDSFESQLEEAVRYGILDSARVQEIRRTPQKFVKALIDTKPRALGKIGRGGERVKNTSVEVYAMADAWVKIAAFQARTNTLEKFYKAEGVEKSAGAIKAEAANTIKDTNITYGRTPALVRAAERTGFTTFMPYFVSVFRAIGYNYGVGVKDAIRAVHATTPKGKALMAAESAKRLAGTSTATFAFTYALKSLAAMLSGDDEEKIEEMKKLMFPDARFADSIYLGTDAGGVPLFARLSRMDPFGPATDALRIAIDEDATPEQKSRFIIDMYKDMVITNRATLGVLKVANEYLSDEDLTNKNTKFERITGKGAENIKEWITKIPTVETKDAEAIIQFIDSLTPGMLDVFDPKNTGVTDPGGTPYKGTPQLPQEVREILSIFVTHSGGRLDRADPGLAAYIAGAELNDVRKEYRKRLNAGVATGRSQETLQDLFIEGSQKEHEKFSAIGDIYSGMVNGMDMTQKQAMETLKEDGSLTADDIAAIRQARPNSDLEDWIKRNSRLVRRDSIEKDLERDMESMTPEEREATQEDIDQFLENMKDLYGVQTK